MAGSPVTPAVAGATHIVWWHALSGGVGGVHDATAFSTMGYGSSTCVGSSLTALGCCVGSAGSGPGYAGFFHAIGLADEVAVGDAS